MEIAALMAGAASGAWVNAAGPDARPLLDALASESDFAWTLAAPPGLMGERLADLRAAFDGLIGDRAAVEDAARVGVALSPVPAEIIEARVAALHGLDGATRNALLKLIAPP